MRALPILLLFLTRSLLKCCALGGIRAKWGLLNPPKLLRNLELHAVIPPLLLPPITPTSTKPPNLIKNEMGQAICLCQPRAASPKLRWEVRETLRRPNRRIPRPAAMSRSEKQTTPFACRIFLLGLPLSLQSTSLFSAKFKYQVKKEKLGERITALQQLVSPFGKTDTASVLHEAMGYIRFLQDQVQVLCSPYLQTLPSSAHMSEGGENGEEKSSKDLRSRGLCLVPVECTEHVANNNGADYWSPAMANTSYKK
ncbi:uncharacterized protein LOC117910867 isoform X2 [Vitis riparia]|uniref:uncharacterized protein LOC117910867 isoform X2 n=1 Tax=Vitis riparia TaxID=96939 RepID=UPI00155ADE82|nr:uncharacterized protein LOC117910867 isoform X2 [Vitis riparia]